MLRLIQPLWKFCLSLNGVNIHTQTPLYFNTTKILSAEPMKKKKRLDPMILKKREERRIKRLEKQIKMLQKTEKQLKPIEEIQIDRKLLEEKTVRMRKTPKTPPDELKQRNLLKREWSDYKRKQFLIEQENTNRLITSTQNALKQLKLESEELYQQAIQLDPSLIPFVIHGPVDTPPIANYDPIDGVYLDKTRIWSKRSVLPTTSHGKKK